MPVTVGPSTLTINHDRQFLISQRNATMAPQDDVGFYARDTRFVSGYGVTVNGRLPRLLDAITVEHFSARYEIMTPELHLGAASLTSADGILPEGSVGFRLERTVLEGVHEDYDLTNYATHPARLLLEIQIESDFADVFDVRSHRLIRRGDLQTTWRPRIGELRSTYRNRSFRRALLVKVEKAGSKPEYANGRLVFLCELAPRAEWHVCLKWLPVIGPRPARTLPCHALSGEARVLHPLAPVELVTSHPTLPAIWRQAVEDTEALRMVDTTVRGGAFVPAAGIPWFVTLFGRDSLVVSMESISAFPEFALGALRTLAQVQATDDDAEQDKEPGKIPHEIRSGELASLKLLPFAPYYGTADATPLFIIVLSYAYQWSGDVGLLRRYRRNAEAALNGLHQGQRAMETVAANAGHCLVSGIVPPERAGRVVDRLMADDMWSGWRIRTLATKHPGYNPYSYHCGAIWPHDNATIAGGFRRAGRHLEAQRVAEGIFAAAERFDAYRLPELFSGLPRDAAAFPVPYLGANVPQAWAAAAVFRLVAILCGIHTVGRTRTMYVNPDLPDWLPSLTLRNLRAGHGAMELHLERDRVQAVGNTTGFKVVHGRLPRPALVEAPLARS